MHHRGSREGLRGKKDSEKGGVVVPSCDSTGFDVDLDDHSSCVYWFLNRLVVFLFRLEVWE